MDYFVSALKSTRRAAFLVFLLCFRTLFGGLIGYEIIDNAFYPQLFGTALFLGFMSILSQLWRLPGYLFRLCSGDDVFDCLGLHFVGGLARFWCLHPIRASPAEEVSRDGGRSRTLWYFRWLSCCILLSNLWWRTPVMKGPLSQYIFG